MYQEFFGLNRTPFHITPDPEFLYLSPSHQEALAAIVYGVEQRKGFIVVLGEVGLGKTTILRSYLAALDRTRLSTAYVFNANVTFKALPDTIYQELGIADKPDDVFGMVNRLHQVVIEEYRQGRNVVLVIDEAQNMPLDTLENLRVLSNLETSTDKLIQIVLVGQPEFADKLDLRELRQLKQRVAVRSTLSPFTDAESQAYIEHRLNKGSSTSSLFSRGALRRIVTYAQGIPRVLNILCDNALVTGLGYQKKPVTARIRREAILDLTGARVRGRPLARPRWWRRWPPARCSSRHRQPADAVRVGRVAGAAARASSGARGHCPVASGAAASLARPGEDGVATAVIVGRGDTLLVLARDVYGFADERVMQVVLEANPAIEDPDRLLVGSAVRFPAIPGLGAQASRAR